MARSIGMAIVLFLLWLLMSGHGEPWLLGLGVASAILVTWVARRLETVDHEGYPLHLAWRGMLYWPWLLLEIIKANIDVARTILSNSDSVDPSVFKVKASQSDDLGRVIYANSITLTPGTVTMDVAPDGWLTIHALNRSAREGLEGGEMDRRVSRLMGES